MTKLRNILTFQYSIALVSIALLFIGSYLMVANLIDEQRYDEKIINIAGRQRMLSQKIAKEALALADTTHQNHWDKHEKDLASTIDLFWDSYQNLKGESQTMDFVDMHSAKIDSLLQVIEPRAEAMRKSTEQLLQVLKDSSDTRMSLLRERVSPILKQEEQLLQLSDELVVAYEAESQTHVEWLKKAQLFILVAGMTVVVASVFGIFRPMVNRIMRDRSRLAQTNEALQTSEEELRQQQEEILAQRDTLEQSNKRLKENEELMKRFIERLKKHEQELVEKNEDLQTSEEELRQQQEEILAQREAVEGKSAQLKQVNIQLKENEELMIEAISKLQTREKELERKNNFIELSIRSAEHIQSSILPDKLIREEALSEHCLFYLPKDVVSGDFYWLSQHGAQTLVGVIDCTGHGISGAFISLLGYSILRQVVYQQKRYSPGRVLVELNQGISEYLREEENHSNYGMDAGFCLINRSDELEPKITFAGAKSKLYYTSEGAVEMLQGDRSSLGGYYAKRATEFEETSLVLAPGTFIYMATDGYVDQANPQRQKFGKKRFMRLLAKLQEEPMHAQQEQLAQAFHEHRQDFPQRDDVTVLGFRV